MPWRNGLLSGSFKGVPFKLDGHDGSDGGRRAVTHEFPQRDVPYTEDLGKEAGKYSINAYVIGDEYMAQRDALLLVCRSPGPGPLVHPYLGIKTVMCTGCAVVETTREGRMARLSLTFVESGIAAFPGVFDEPALAAGVTAAQLSSSASSDFVDSFTVSGLQQYVRSDAENLVVQAANTVRSATAALAANSVKRSEFNAQVTNLENTASVLVSNPASLVESLADIIGAVNTTFTEPAPRRDALREIHENFNITLVEVVNETAGRVQQRANGLAMKSLVRSVSLAEMIVAALTAEYETLDQARAMRIDLIDRIDAVIDAVSDDVYTQLTGLRSQVIRGLPPQVHDLPRLITIQLAKAEPSLVVAYRRYKDATRGGEIVARNGIRHPGFMPGGTELEVLTVE